MTATLEGGEWSAARSGRTLSPGKTGYPLYRRLGGHQGRSGRAENLVPTRNRSRSVQPVVSRYNGWAALPIYIYIYIYTHTHVSVRTAQHAHTHFLSLIKRNHCCVWTKITACIEIPVQHRNTKYSYILRKGLRISGCWTKSYIK